MQRVRKGLGRLYGAVRGRRHASFGLGELRRAACAVQGTLRDEHSTVESSVPLSAPIRTYLPGSLLMSVSKTRRLVAPMGAGLWLSTLVILLPPRGPAADSAGTGAP